MHIRSELSSFHLRLFFLYGISINAGMALFTLLYNSVLAASESSGGFHRAGGGHGAAGDRSAGGVAAGYVSGDDADGAAVVPVPWRRGDCMHLGQPRSFPVRQCFSLAPRRGSGAVVGCAGRCSDVLEPGRGLSPRLCRQRPRHVHRHARTLPLCAVSRSGLFADRGSAAAANAGPRRQGHACRGCKRRAGGSLNIPMAYVSWHRRIERFARFFGGADLSGRLWQPGLQRSCRPSPGPSLVTMHGRDSVCSG